MPSDSSVHPSQAPPGLLRFGCPACQRELTIPANLAGVEGPCPLCHQKIVAPSPALGLAPHLAGVPVPSVPAPFPTPGPPDQAQVPAPLPPVETPPAAAPASPAPQAQAPAQPTAPPAQRRVHCSSCGSALDVDPSVKVAGGPCPVCQTWIDLSGRSADGLPSPNPPSSPPQAQPEEVQRTIAPPAQRRRRSPGGSGTELPPPNNQGLPAENTEPAEQGDEEEVTYEKRRVRRRKKRRVLPDECYVGAAQRDPRDGTSEDSAGSSKQRKRRGKKAIKLDDDQDSAVSRFLPIFFGVLIPLIAGVLIALKMGWITPQDLRFWEPKGSAMNGAPNHGLVEELQVTRREMNLKEGEAYDAVETSIHGFLNAETWEEAETYLISEAVPANSEALAFLKVFPREEFRGCTIRVIRWSRIPDTDRFVFTTQLAVPDEDSGGEKLSFMIAEQRPSGNAGIHALQLYQSWKQTLTEFLETPGANEGRFYALVQLHDGSSGPAPIALPEDGEYARLRLQDNFVSHYWTTDAYVRKDSYPGIRFDPKLTVANWSYAILDLEWRQGPAGDSFVNVKGLHSSSWGDFHH